MRVRVLGLFATLCFAFFFVVGCAWKTHMKRGDQHMAAKNYDAAAEEYGQALRRKPDNAELKQKLGRAQDAQIEQRVVAARAQLAAGDDRGAITLAAEALGILPDSEKTKALLDEVVTTTTQRARANADAGQFAMAMATYDAIIVGLPTAKAKVEADALATARAWVAQMTPLADAAEKAGRIATALLYRAQIAKLLALGVAERDALRARADQELRYTIRVKVKPGDAGAASVVATLGPSMGAALVSLSPDARNAPATLSFSVGKPRVKTDKSRRPATARYQSGTTQVQNPFYKQAQDDVLAEEKRLVDAENEVTKQEQYVTKYSADVAREGDTPGVSTGAEQNLSNAQSRLEAARRNIQSQRDAVIRAKEKLSNTPQTKEEAVFSTHTYDVTTHTLTASVVIKGTIKHADGRPATVINTPLEVKATDDAHPAQDIAGVTEDPLALPSQVELADKLYGEAASPVRAAVDESFNGHRAHLLQTADAAQGDARLEGLVRYILSDPGNVDPAVVQSVFSVSGVPAAGQLLGPR